MPCSTPKPPTTQPRAQRSSTSALNAPYTSWPERFPLQRAVLSAAERQGALLVSRENVYGYGPTGGKPMTEDLPLAATTGKGGTRAGNDPGAAVSR